MTGLRICLTAGVGFLALALAGTGRLCAQVADAAPAEGATERRTSLNGTWKFSGLAAAPRPFGSLTDKERERLSPMTDDADWQTIPVPRDWWTLPKYETYRSGPFDTNRVYFCGFYRKASSGSSCGACQDYTAVYRCWSVPARYEPEKAW